MQASRDHRSEQPTGRSGRGCRRRDRSAPTLALRRRGTTVRGAGRRAQPFCATARRRSALILLALFALVAILAPVIAPGDPTDFVARPHLAPSGEHCFGTTGSGQDVFDQTVWGARLTAAGRRRWSAC